MKNWGYDEDEVVSVAQAMRILNVRTRATITSYIRRGLLRGRRMSPQPHSPFLIYRDSIDEFLRKSCEVG
jgi:hypothetical protein